MCEGEADLRVERYRVAAISVAQRVAEEVGCVLGDEVSLSLVSFICSLLIRTDRVGGMIDRSGTMLDSRVYSRKLQSCCI